MLYALPPIIKATKTCFCKKALLKKREACLKSCSTSKSTLKDMVLKELLLATPGGGGGAIPTGGRGPRLAARP